MNSDNESLYTIPQKNIIGKLSPVIRFWRYIKSEKKDIWIIYTYALIVGLIGLSLPLGIQAVIQMISGGILYDTAILIIILVLLGVAITGSLQVMQIYMVEILQRRLFAKATFDFAYRLPKIQADELAGDYPPEVVNRFFDVVLLQKGISKLLIELTTAILQVFFGLLLLAIYHPSFIVFDIVFITAVYIVFRVTGKKGLETSLKESSYKYKIMAWLQDIARNTNTFKLSGDKSNLAQEKTDNYTVKYLTARKVHFKVLISQYINILFFKISIIAATLILGSLLVVEREINLGQFVATEIIIVLILSAIEKIIISVDTVYDAFTSVEKIAKISDFALEHSGNIKANEFETPKGFEINIKELSYNTPLLKNTLNNINLTIAAGSTIAIAGNNSYGIDALINVISGIYSHYDGIAEVNGIAIKDVDLKSYRGHIAMSLPNEGLFEGTILENIIVGNTAIPEIEAIKILQKLEAYDEISKLPDGMNYKINHGGIGLPKELSSKILIAKNILKKPKLWILHEHNYNEILLAFILFKDYLPKPTTIVISNNEQIHQRVQHIYLIDNGNIVVNGNYNDIKKNDKYNEVIKSIFNA